MAMRNPYAGLNQYKQNNIIQASREGLTLMLFNGIIKFISQAKIHVDNKSIENAHNAIIRADDIIIELNSTLDMQYDISKNLRSLYFYMSKRLADANMRKDKEILDEVLELVTELRDTWKEAMEIANKK
ncbi:MAG: flagellar export chaperone FliS [Anaeromicrobium sp.]|jgi:flagellar protein FliS|uniref:flagellar export chaperone FliS n=1 Tax=Anaeromicrobium sp. TaxID=1929132 RepID=UPI0025EE2881|nr:flagellar export chaperone FliS [Anaeromicrobium sp.]MCT4592708.1 flagellar export chaperone FliS [Anaeromicrobium sp.]